MPGTNHQDSFPPSIDESEKLLMKKLCHGKMRFRQSFMGRFWVWSSLWLGVKQNRLWWEAAHRGGHTWRLWGNLCWKYFQVSRQKVKSAGFQHLFLITQCCLPSAPPRGGVGSHKGRGRGWTWELEGLHCCSGCRIDVYFGQAAVFVCVCLLICKMGIVTLEFKWQTVSQAFSISSFRPPFPLYLAFSWFEHCIFFCTSPLLL